MIGGALTTDTEDLQRVEFESLVARHDGCATFARVLDGLRGRDQLLRMLSRYVEFNSVFGGGVARLSGEIAARQGLFKAEDDDVELLMDRSVEVAAGIFVAAVDEFDGFARGPRATHRALAQATLRVAARFLGFAGAAIDGIGAANEATRMAVERILQGYGLAAPLDRHGLVRAIGFHMASERLASEEFSALDRYLCVQHPALVEYLRSTILDLNGRQCDAYLWIACHADREIGHFDAALGAANQALRHWAGPEPRTHVKEWMLEGFTEFGALQAEFMGRLMD